nr:SEC1 family transport protein SLY1-like isoform X2 [Physcomitrium patens]|eukprot:XP_024390597.1 SEC1 family transport protein SLY1-like isoform X2 [Physcomitrella patens]
MLNLNYPILSGGTADEEVYKVLIYDHFCRDILSPLIRVNALRKHGITLYLGLAKERQNVPDMPAIYFVQPLQANIQRIMLDASRGMYEAFHLNFSSSLSWSLLEELAKDTLKTDCFQRIAKVYDQYLEFVTLENGMFCLAQPLSYVHLNDPAAQEQDVQAVIEGITNGLFSVLATLGVVPVIRCARGGPAEMVAGILDGRIRDHLVSRNNLFTEAGHMGFSFQRPVLCLFDHNFELSVAVRHSWSYRPLVHDVLNMKLNRVQVEGAGLGSKGKSGVNTYELDDIDSYWVANANALYPKAA